MRDFEELLPRALMAANLTQFQRTLEQAEALDPDFSPRYCRSRLRLLNDPQAWMRRRARPFWQRAAKNAACILLACAVALGSLMAVSPTVRAAVLHWLREFTGYNIIYHPVEQDSEIPPSWRPAWLPEGWRLEELMALPDRIRWMFGSEMPSDGAWGHLTFTCYSPGSGGMDVGSDQEYTHQRTTVQGVPADYYENAFQMLLFWESPQGHLLSVSMSGTDRDALERVAESMTFYTGSDVRYEVGGLPDEDAFEMHHMENIGVGQFQWFMRNDILTFQYMKDPPCALSSPERESEEVTVGGLPARFWPCELPEEEVGDGRRQENDEITLISGTSYSADQAALLFWEDPETNTTFQICGVLDKDEALRMAESVTAVKLS